MNKITKGKDLLFSLRRNLGDIHDAMKKINDEHCGTEHRCIDIKITNGENNIHNYSLPALEARIEYAFAVLDEIINIYCVYCDDE